MNIITFDTIVCRDARRNGFINIYKHVGEMRYLLSTTAHEGQVEVSYDENGMLIVPISPYIKDGKAVNEITLGADDKLADKLNELHKYYMAS